METPQQKPSPADRIIDRHMPNATAEEREEARENLRRLARVLLSIEERQAREWYEQRIRETCGGKVNSEKRPSLPL